MDTAVSLQAKGQSQSTEELEGVIWPDPASRSHVVQTSHALRRKPLRDMTDEELRVGLEQQVGLRFLVPLAVERLQSEPLLEARIYAGDLLQSLLLVPPDFWRRNADLRELAAGVASLRWLWPRAAPIPGDGRSFLDFARRMTPSAANFHPGSGCAQMGERLLRPPMSHRE